MKMPILLIIVLLSLSFPDSNCILVGEVDNRSSDTLLLYKASDFNDLLAKIPIVNNRFKYEFPFEFPEVYELVFQEERKRGSMKVISFFAEDGQINFNLDNDTRFKESDVSGGPLNIEVAKYNNEIVKFWEEIKMYSDSMSALPNIPESLEEWNRFREIQESISYKRDKWELDYIDSTTSLLAYYKLMRFLKPGIKYCCLGEVDNNFIKRAENNLHRLSQSFPDHPYEEVILRSINEKRNINVGGKFSDFQLSTIDEKRVKVSDVIASNKITLLNFWSKWCKVCVENNDDLISIYNEFRTKGFEIVGITENYKDAEDLVEFIKQENYPWNDLIDVDGTNRIRDAYSVSQTGGVTFLIDSTGKIIGVNLNNDQLVSKIKSYLN